MMISLCRSREQFRLGGTITIVGKDHTDEALLKVIYSAPASEK